MESEAGLNGSEKKKKKNNQNKNKAKNNKRMAAMDSGQRL